MLKNLRILREKTNISQRQLAEAIGVSQQSINKYENHNIEPDIGTLIRIADYFGTTVDYLVDHTAEPEKPIFVSKYMSLTENQKQAVDAVMDAFHHS